MASEGPVVRIVWGGRAEMGVLRELEAGTSVELTGGVITLRDASAKRLTDGLNRGGAPPVDLDGQLLYAVGPSPPKPGQIVGSAGPTTTARLAAFFPALMSTGVRGIIGKGELHGAAAECLVRHGAVYLAAVGGIGALLAKAVRSATVVAYPELGSEAIYRFELADFPAVLAIDARGRNFHETARLAWSRQR